MSDVESLSKIGRVCVQWPRFGPYHIARLRALSIYASARGAEVIGLETAGSDQIYDWNRIDEELPFKRVQVFPERVFEEIDPGEMHSAIINKLDLLDPDGVIINSYSFPDARACLSWCRSRKRVAVVATDSKEDAAERKPWREYFKSVLVNQFDAALLAGTPHSEYFEKLGFPAEYIFLGYDVVDNDYFRERALAVRAYQDEHRSLPGLESNRPFFLTSGRYIPQKNLETLLHAYASYRTKVASPWRLVMVGDGPLRDRYVSMINELALEDVTLTGFRQIHEIPAYYALASVYVHPAINDQWGLVVNEAMAAGLPVLVSSRTGCARDLVRSEVNGFVFDPLDREELADLLVRISSGEYNLDQMGRESERTIARWSPDYFASQAWSALSAGLERSRRNMDLRASLGLWTLRQLSTDVAAFHTVKP